MLKRLLLSGIALGVATGMAGAADLAPMYKAPPMPERIQGWGGFYTGSHAGWLSSSGRNVQASGPAYNFSLDGGLIGGQFGFNWQHGAVVFGVEGDLSTVAADNRGNQFVPANEIEGARIDTAGTVRGRLGYAMGGILPYITGGFAAAHASFVNDAAFTNRWFYGWTVGGGVEAMVAPNFTVRLEYLYADYGRRSFLVDGAGQNVDFRTHQVRVGFNYLFGDRILGEGAPAFIEPVVSDNWSGLYVGSHAGWLGGRSQVTNVATGATGRVRPSGYTSGLYLGYNWQAGNIIWGAEADIAVADVRARGAGVVAAVGLEQVGIDWLSTARGRVGVGFGRFMLFGTGGFAYAQGDLYANASRAKVDMTGWTVGGGIEAKLTDRTTVRAEYLHLDLGSAQATVDGTARRANFSGQTVRVGASLHF